MITDVQKIAVSSALAGMFLGWFLTAFVFYPPHPGWAMTEHWGDVATWASGAATFLAVCVAIGVPWIKERQRRAEQHQREFRSGQIAAIELVNVMLGIHKAAIERRMVVLNASSGAYDVIIAPFATAATLYGADDLPHGSDLIVLPYPLPPTIASLRTALTMYNAALGRAIGLTKTMSLADAIKREKLAEALDHAQSALARAAKHLAKYEPFTGDINFLDKGDGSELTPLNDYIGDEAFRPNLNSPK